MKILTKYDGYLMASFIDYAREVVTGHRQLCRCGASRWEHSHGKEECPNPADHGDLYLKTRFRPLQCEASVNEGQCSNPATQGRMCDEHYVE